MFCDEIIIVHLHSKKPAATLLFFGLFLPLGAEVFGKSQSLNVKADVRAESNENYMNSLKDSVRVEFAYFLLLA